MSDGSKIAASVDPNTSDDVCTFCRHARSIVMERDRSVDCALGFTGYFRSLSNMGPIFVSDCRRGELRPELAEIDRNKGAGRPLVRLAERVTTWWYDPDLGETADGVPDGMPELRSALAKAKENTSEQVRNIDDVPSLHAVVVDHFKNPSSAGEIVVTMEMADAGYRIAEKYTVIGIYGVMDIYRAMETERRRALEPKQS